MYLHCIYTLPGMLSSPYGKILQNKLAPHAPRPSSLWPPVPPTLHQSVPSASPEPRRSTSYSIRGTTARLRGGSGGTTEITERGIQLSSFETTGHCVRVRRLPGLLDVTVLPNAGAAGMEIGRASCRERV